MRTMSVTSPKLYIEVSEVTAVIVLESLILITSQRCANYINTPALVSLNRSPSTTTPSGMSG